MSEAMSKIKITMYAEVNLYVLFAVRFIHFAVTLFEAMTISFKHNDNSYEFQNTEHMRMNYIQLQVLVFSPCVI